MKNIKNMILVALLGTGTFTPIIKADNSSDQEDFDTEEYSSRQDYSVEYSDESSEDSDSDSDSDINNPEIKDFKTVHNTLAIYMRYKEGLNFVKNLDELKKIIKSTQEMIYLTTKNDSNDDQIKQFIHNIRHFISEHEKSILEINQLSDDEFNVLINTTKQTINDVFIKEFTPILEAKNSPMINSINNAIESLKVHVINTLRFNSVRNIKDLKEWATLFKNDINSAAPNTSEGAQETIQYLDNIIQNEKINDDELGYLLSTIDTFLNGILL